MASAVNKSLGKAIDQRAFPQVLGDAVFALHWTMILPKKTWGKFAHLDRKIAQNARADNLVFLCPEPPIALYDSSASPTTKGYTASEVKGGSRCAL